jgi:protein gp37
MAMRRMAPEWQGSRPWSEVRCHTERLEQPLHWRRPRKIFVCSMGDLFHEAVPDEFVHSVWITMIRSPLHTFQILTKRPARMADWFRKQNGRCEFPALKNVWLGVSISNQADADERIPILLQTPAAVRFVSYEPALGPVNLSELAIPETRERSDGLWTLYWNALTGHRATCPYSSIDGAKLDWVIAGGETGPGARPAHPDWFRSVRDACVSAGVPFFFKGWGEWAPKEDHPHLDEFELYRGKPRMIAVQANGKKEFAELDSDFRMMVRVGKKSAGRLLDGREWNEFPRG